MFGSGNLGMGVTFTLQNNASGPAQQAGSSITGLSRTVEQAATNISNAAGKIQSGILGVVTAVMMLVGPFVNAVETSMEFNFQISRAGAISRATAEDINLLRKAAFDLGNTTMFTATEVAKTEVVLAQAGFAVQQQLEILPGLVDLATAGVVGLDYAAGIASDTLFQFGLATKDMGRVADVIVNAANMSNMSVENFGNAMKYLGPTAKAFGMSLEESAGYIEMMANSGMRGSIGTRAFGTSLVNLASPTKQAAELMEQLNFEAYDSAGRFVGLTEMVRRLGSSLTGLTNKERDNALSIIFGNEAIQEMLQLLNLEFRAIENGTEVVYRGADALEYFTKKNMEAKGVAHEVATGMMNNLKSDVKLLTAAWETMNIRIGDIQEGPLRGIVREMRSWVVGITNLLQTKFGQWLVGIAATVSVVAAGMIALGFAITIVLPAVWSMVTAVGALMIELAPIILAIGAVVGLVILLKKSFDEFTEFLEGRSDVATGFLGLMQKIGGVMMAIFEIWTSWNGETFTLSQNLHDALQRLGILDFVLNLATWLVRIKEFFVGVIEGLVNVYVIVEMVFIYLKDAIVSFIDTLVELGIIDKLTLDLESFATWGRIVGMVVGTLIAPFTLLAATLALIINSIEWLIDNAKTLGSWFPSIFDIWDAALGSEAESKAAQGRMFNTNFTPFAKGNVMPATNPITGQFDFSEIGKRQAEILTQFGMRSSGQATIPAPAGSNIQETFVMPIYLDSEKISESVFEKEQLKNSRQ